jgi:hypothetical protein
LKCFDKSSGRRGANAARAEANRSLRDTQSQAPSVFAKVTELRRFLMLSVAPATLGPATGASNGSTMADARIGRLFFGARGSRVVSAAALAGLLATASPVASLAQDAGVSGIPPGPGNVNGLNGSIRDPSGIGNASKLPPLPQPSIRPVTPTTVAPLSSTRPSLRQGSARLRITTTQRTRFASSRAQRRADSAAVKENDRLLNHGVTSICRGC